MAYRNKNELLDIEGDLIGWDDEIQHQFDE